MRITRKLVISTVVTAFALSVGLNVFFLAGNCNEVYAGKLGLTLFGKLALVQEVLDHVTRQYVEPEKVKEDKLIYGAVEGLLVKLGDPYSRFMDPSVFKEMQIETKGAFGGLGLIIGQKENRILVISPLVGTPAFRAGIESNDEIVKVDTEPVKGKTVSDVANLLRGKIGTKVHVTLYREGNKKLLEFDIVREEIKVPSVSSRMLDGKLGYIYLSQFIATSGADVEKRLEAFEKDGMRGLILDLRHNPGGLLEAAVAVSSAFVTRGATVVSVKDNGGNEMRHASTGSSHPPFPLVVLVDGGSASASEITAGAVRDHKRGILIGSKSFGKGSVQTVLPLSDGSALALTTAYYYTPAGTLIHNRGLQPDIEVALPQMNEDEIRKLRDERTKFLDDTPPQPGKPPKPPIDFEFLRKYDTQLQRAIDVLVSSEVFVQQLRQSTPGR
ncbi:MAG: S41 family peptidase [Candidatus Riflebacteria bacterium]|nr:S41 family peptidase [Candidatus Riflebacteria bacterium]